MIGSVYFWVLVFARRSPGLSMVSWAEREDDRVLNVSGRYLAASLVPFACTLLPFRASVTMLKSVC